MNTHLFPDEQAGIQETETFLRATLREHAPQTIDLEQGWAAVSPQLTSLSGKVQPGTSLRLITRDPPRRTPSRRRWPILAAVAALVVALLGAGFAGPFSHWFGGQPSTAFAYTTINQRMQISNEITLTAVKGYADPKHLILSYDVQVASGLTQKQRQIEGLVVSTTVQGENLKARCAQPAKESEPVIHCVLALPGHHGDIPGDTLKITWQVSEIHISLSNTHTILAKKGNWTLTFSLPFHHQVQDPPVTTP